MEDKLLKIIYDYSFCGRMLGPNEIKKLLEYLVDYYDLNDYIDFVKVTDINYNSEDKILIHYFRDKKQFVIYSNTIKTITRDMFNNSIFNRFDAIYYINIYVMHIVLHEIDHLFQTKNSINKSNLTEEIIFLVNNISKYIYSRLLSQDLSIEELKNKINVIKNIFTAMWEYAPHERLAEYNSYKKIISIKSEIEEK